MACLGLVTAGHRYVFLLSRTLCAASAAACLRLLCVVDLIGRATSLIAVRATAGGVLKQVSQRASPRCNACNALIVGSDYYTVRDDFYCDDCYL